jgi:hypothetical protein
MRKIAYILIVSLTGCTLPPTVMMPPPYEEHHAAPYLLQQYAPLNGAALRVCCGHKRHCLPHQSDRC